MRAWARTEGRGLPIPPSGADGAALRRVAVLLIALAALLVPAGASASAPVSTYQVLQRSPHDIGAFTEGLVYADGVLYESTGLNGASTLRKVDFETGAMLASIPIPDQYFAEGLTLFDGRLYQLTWQSHIGFIYDLGCFCRTGDFTYDTEGWGLTHDARRLIMSDGTPIIRFLDPDTLAVTGAIAVHDGDQLIPQLNELEYINGEIWANVWQTDRIARIDPATGAVLGWVDLTGLLPGADRSPETDVLNGIAYDPATNRLFVTGKRWPALFLIAVLGPGTMVSPLGRSEWLHAAPAIAPGGGGL
jgi:glutamine cyclotransferase